ncbi:hypothetical protein EH228_11875 [Erwinia endophytica]|uniref:hypothetical protein n=1 Tax=Erwinia endophytica TaxID=1563158 RepID=UPI001265D777|nr:hypothetical protein [Erwinia endophytica]KAB8310001.1 hypothetical protein EH228_11875 [Erwinia endophytica]
MMAAPLAWRQPVPMAVLVAQEVMAVMAVLRVPAVMVATAVMEAMGGTVQAEVAEAAAVSVGTEISPSPQAILPPLKSLLAEPEAMPVPGSQDRPAAMGEQVAAAGRQESTVCRQLAVFPVTGVKAVTGVKVGMAEMAPTAAQAVLAA